MENKQSIQVKIFDTDYALRTDGDPEAVRLVARFVDEQIRSLSENTSVKSPMKIAVLAALNIAEELFEMKRKYGELLQNLESVETKSKELSESVDTQISAYSELVK